MSLNSLPDKAIIEILNNLSPVELIFYRQVCKLWKKLIDDEVEGNRELILFVDLPVQNYVRWSYNNEKINPYNSLSINGKIISNMMFVRFFLYKYFQKINKLLIYCYLMDEKFFKNIMLMAVSLKDLIHFQFEFAIVKGESCYCNPLKFRTGTRFNRLKSFTMPLHYPFDGIDTIDFENLERLSFCELEISEKNYEWSSRLKYLKVTLLEYSRLDLKFLNLKVLYLIPDTFRRINTPAPLSLFPSLIEMHVYRNDYGWAPFLKFVDYYLEEKKRYQRDDLKIYVKGFEYTDELTDQPFMEKDETKCISEEFLEYYKDHHSSFKFADDWEFNLTDKFITILENMNDLKERLISNMTICAIKDNYENLTRTNLVFENCKSIIFNRCLIHQLDLESLPRVFPNIRKIMFWRTNEIELTKNNEVDLTFISKFKSMKYIYLKLMRVSLEELEKIVENCRYLYIVEFYGLIFSINENSEVIFEQEKETFKTKSSFLDYVSQNRNIKLKEKKLEE